MKFEILRPARKEKENPVHILYDQFVEFVTSTHPSTADEVRAAYEALLEKKESDAPESLLLAEMRCLEKAGLPLNRFAEAIGTLQNLEDAMEVYFAYVETLPVSDKEKVMLRSIVAEKRRGVVEVKVDGRELATIELNAIDPGMIEFEFLHALQEVMKRIEKGKGKDVEFTLVE